MLKNKAILTLIVACFVLTMSAQVSKKESLGYLPNTLEIEYQPVFWIKTYPNPACDVLLIEHNAQPDQSFEILNESGQVVIRGYLNDQLHLVNLKEQPQGLYFLVIGNQVNKVLKVDL